MGVAGCESYDRFDTAESGLFRGVVLGTADDSFIRRGFVPETTLALSFDPASTQRVVAGAITATEPDGDVVLDDVALEVIAPLAHDLLADYSFPGASRLQNFLFLARPTEGPLVGRELMVFLSLLETGEIEVRIIGGVGDESAGDVFGVFRLRRDED